MHFLARSLRLRICVYILETNTGAGDIKFIFKRLCKRQSAPRAILSFEKSLVSLAWAVVESGLANRRISRQSDFGTRPVLRIELASCQYCHLIVRETWKGGKT